MLGHAHRHRSRVGTVWENIPISLRGEQLFATFNVTRVPDGGQVLLHDVSTRIAPQLSIYFEVELQEADNRSLGNTFL